MEYKILKIVTGENILCTTNDTDIFNGTTILISEPIVVSIIKLPTPKGTVERCVMYPWNLFSADNIYEVATSQIIAVTDPTEEVKNYYQEYLDKKDNYTEDSSDSVEDQFFNEEEDAGTDYGNDRNGKPVYH